MTTANRDHLEAEAELIYEWLGARGCDFTDVLHDEDGTAYIMREEESDHSDTYQIDVRRVEIPKFSEGQIKNWLKNNPK